MGNTILRFDTNKGRRLTIKREELLFEPPTTPVAVNTPPPLITQLEYLTKKNSAMNLLIENLDLEEVGISKFIASERPAEINPPEEPAVAPPPKEPLAVDACKKLLDIATRSLPIGNSYTREQALSQIQSTINVSLDRAQKGFDMMIEYKILDSRNDQYYLFDSIPF